MAARWRNAMKDSERLTERFLRRWAIDGSKVISVEFFLINSTFSLLLANFAHLCVRLETFHLGRWALMHLDGKCTAQNVFGPPERMCRLAQMVLWEEVECSIHETVSWFAGIGQCWKRRRRNRVRWKAFRRVDLSHTECRPALLGNQQTNEQTNLHKHVNLLSCLNGCEGVN